MDSNQSGESLSRNTLPTQNPEGPFDLHAAVLAQAFPTDSSRMAFVMSLLTGNALSWATAMWQAQVPESSAYANFERIFREVFDHPVGGQAPGERLLTLKQGSRTAAEHALHFRILAAEAGWDERSLKTVCRRSLKQNWRAEEPIIAYQTSSNCPFPWTISFVPDAVRPPTPLPSHLSFRLPLSPWRWAEWSSHLRNGKDACVRVSAFTVVCQDTSEVTAPLSGIPNG
ncbi:hypothetical protein AOLI_G00116720 [Acnodon oligacanthus]